MTGARHADRLARLRDRAAAERPEAWRPDAGDTLAGELLRYETGTTERGLRHIAIIRDEAGAERAVWLLQAVLLDEFKKLRPAPGCSRGPLCQRARGEPAHRPLRGDGWLGVA